jgi:hypothetical protein
MRCVGAGSEQRAHDLNVATAAGEHQRCLAIIGRRVNARARGEKHAHNFDVTHAAGEHHRRGVPSLFAAFKLAPAVVVNGPSTT